MIYVPFPRPSPHPRWDTHFYSCMGGEKYRESQLSLPKAARQRLGLEPSRHTTVPLDLGNMCDYQK